MSWVAVVGRGISKNDKTSKKKKDFCGNAGERCCDYEVRQKEPLQEKLRKCNQQIGCLPDQMRGKEEERESTVTLRFLA